MMRVRYTTPARSQGELHAQRTMGRLAEKDVHRWVFAHSMDPDVETSVREWLLRRLNAFHCELQLMYTPHVRSTSLAGTHVVLNNTPPLSSLARGDEAVEVDARGLNALGAVKALIEATGLDPRLSVCGWPFCLDDVDAAEGGAA